MADSEVIGEEAESRFVWKGKFQAKDPSLSEAAKVFGCFGAFVPSNKLKFRTGSTRSLRDPVRPLKLRQRAREGDTGKSSGREEMADVQVIEVFGLTELVDNLEVTFKPMVSCTKKAVIAPISCVAQVAVDLLKNLGIGSSKKINSALGGVSQYFAFLERTTSHPHDLHIKALHALSVCRASHGIRSLDGTEP